MKASMQDLERMIATVKKDTKWKDIHKIVDEALRRLREGQTPEPKFITSVEDLPTYIRHWEEAKPDGWEIRILSETGLMTIRCRWKDYKRSRELRCPHN